MEDWYADKLSIIFRIFAFIFKVVAMKYLLLTPPLTQLNTPYPATSVLKGFLQSQGHSVDQGDLGIELIDKVYSKEFLKEIGLPNHANCIEMVMRFLRGQDNTVAPRIANRSLLPEGARFNELADMEWAFGTAGTEDKARYLATLFLEDIADFIREKIDSHFDLIRYAEQLASFAPEFDELEQSLQAEKTCIDQLMLDCLQKHIESSNPDIVGFSIPFPGCLYGALRCGQWLKANRPEITVVFGGGFANTEWRQLQEPRIFDFCDYITLDDGELPLQQIGLIKNIEKSNLVRTYYRNGEGKVIYSGNDALNVDFGTESAPDFEGLPLDKYISLAEMTNPMHRLWSCGRWNKMMMAHGCYWHHCAFCDTTLDYIARYATPTAQTVVDRMEHIMRQTGNSGFHFVDEALPPKLLKEVCEEILHRGLSVSFWGNIRFEKAYTQEFCDLLSDAGCVAVSGGLEVASNRLLKLMDKGVTIEQTVQACRHFRNAGIMVHTYLMYGFPTETLQETFNALETVRSMFDEGIVQSAFWHRYAMTCHSLSGQHPEAYGAKRTNDKVHPFCNNEIDWDNTFDYDIEAVGRGLRFATYNYMHDIGLDQPIKRWFSGKLRAKK